MVKQRLRFACLGFSLLCAVNVFAQGGIRLVGDVGAQAQKTTVVDVGLQIKSYWLFDTANSNAGPGAGIEVNFGSNNSGITIGPKVFYQGDVFMGSFGKTHTTTMYIVARISAIRYTNTSGNDFRMAPEGGVSLYERFTLMYGYNFIMPFAPHDKLTAVYDNRISLFITLGGKKEEEKKIAPAGTN